MRSTSFSTVFATSLLGLANLASAQPRPAVVELYTSEGCSSCPPAEAYVGELTRRGDVLPLTFHVDYWDNLGWRDRFGLPVAVTRQRAYARTLGLSTVYTPQIVVDGQNDFVGSDRRSISRALAPARQGVAVSVALGAGEVLIDIGSEPKAPPSDVLLVAYQSSAVTPIGRGENAGRTIQEFNVVRDLRLLGRWDGEQQRFRTRLDALPPDASNVAVIIQPLGQAPIIGAATLALR